MGKPTEETRLRDRERQRRHRAKKKQKTAAECLDDIRVARLAAGLPVSRDGAGSEIQQLENDVAALKAALRERVAMLMYRRAHPAPTQK